MRSTARLLPYRTAIGAVILAAAVAVAAPAQAADPVTTLASAGPTGADGNGPSNDIAISASGRWVAFDSAATNLVDADTNGKTDVFLRDMQTGAVTRLAPPGVQPDGDSFDPDISDDGSLIAFQSSATNLVPGTTAGHTNVYLFDRTAGTIRRLSNGAAGNGGGGNSTLPNISPDGAAVAFRSFANDLVPGDAGKQDAFLYRVADQTLTRVSQPVDGTQPNGQFGAFWAPVVSNGGQFVAFASDSSNLLPAGADQNGESDVFVRDMVRNTISLVSIGTDGRHGDGDSSAPAISADGCVVAFTSLASDLVRNDDGHGTLKAYVRNRCTSETDVVSLDGGNVPQQVPVDGSWSPAISNDGCRVAYASSAAFAPAGIQAIAVHDTCLHQTSRMDVSTSSDSGNALAMKPTFSGGSGRYVGFDSKATNLALNDHNGDDFDVFVRDTAVTVPPVASLKTAVDGRRVTADASGSTDADSEIASVSMTFGDGTPAASGVTLTHDYTQIGTFTVTATVTDADGLNATTTAAVTITALTPPTGPTPPPPPGQPAPVLSRASLAAAAFAVVPVGQRAGNGRGTRLTVRASETATLTLSYQRVRHGHRKNGTCSATAKRGPTCTFLTTVAGKVTAPIVSGANQIAITGRTSVASLAPGAYWLTLVARTPDHRTSKPVRLRLTIVQPRIAR